MFHWVANTGMAQFIVPPCLSFAGSVALMLTAVVPCGAFCWASSLSEPPQAVSASDDTVRVATRASG